MEDRGELRAIVQNMQLALEARARKENHGFRPFPVQSGIYHVPSLPSLTGTVITSTALGETASLSTVRSIFNTQGVTERPSMESVGEAVASSVSDRDAVSSLASQRLCGHRALANKSTARRRSPDFNSKLSFYRIPKRASK